MQEGLINGGLTVVNEMTLQLRAEQILSAYVAERNPYIPCPKFFRNSSFFLLDTVAKFPFCISI